MLKDGNKQILILEADLSVCPRGGGISMDFELHDTPEMAAFREELRETLSRMIPKELVVSPYEEDVNPEQIAMRRQVGRELGARGWLRPMWPKEYGGGGLTIDQAIVIEQEIDRYEIANPPYDDSGAGLGGPAVMVWANEEQKKAFLPRMARGEVATWQLLTEPHGGSDLASTKTTAIRDGDEYVLNGTKTFVGDTGTPPDLLWTITLTDPQGPRHQNLSWFIIPADLPGIMIQPLDLLSGRGGNKCTVFFEDVRVPSYNLIGGENNGWKVASTHLELEHGGGGTVRGNRQVERFIEYVKSTSFNGQPIASEPDVKDALADLIVEEEVSRLFGLRNFWMSHSKRKMSYEGSQSSYVRKMGGLRKSRLMQQMIGYWAITDDKQYAPGAGWVNSFMKTSIISVHPGGTQDIQRVIMARRMGIGRTVREEAGQLPD